MGSPQVALLLLSLAPLIAALEMEAPSAPTLRTHWGSSADRSNISRRKDRLQPNADIVGGRLAKNQEFPYQVYVRIFHRATDSGEAKTSYCGGAIVSTRHILTAAHCVQKDTVERVEIIAGSLNRWDRAASKFKIVSKNLYTKKENENVEGDIALLMVDRQIPLKTLGINLLKLARQKIPPKTKCVVAGWGDTKRDDTDDDLLMYVSLWISTDEDCERANSDDPTGDLLCAAVPEGGKDTCQGDSGGPLVCGRQIVGVVKGGKGCGLPGFPGTYTEVSYYRQWIRSIIVKEEVAAAFAGRRWKPPQINNRTLFARSGLFGNTVGFGRLPGQWRARS